MAVASPLAAVLARASSTNAGCSTLGAAYAPRRDSVLMPQLRTERALGYQIMYQPTVSIQRARS